MSYKFINTSLPAYFAWHSRWEMCGIQVPCFSPDNNTLRLSDKDTMGSNNRIHRVFRELQARAQTYIDVNVLLSSRTPMDQGQMGAQSSRQAGSQLKQGNGSSNHPVSIWPPHMHKKELNNGLNARSTVLTYLVQPILIRFPQFSTYFCPDSIQISFGCKATTLETFKPDKIAQICQELNWEKCDEMPQIITLEAWMWMIVGPTFVKVWH